MSQQDNPASPVIDEAAQLRKLAEDLLAYGFPSPRLPGLVRLMNQASQALGRKENYVLSNGRVLKLFATKSLDRQEGESV